MVNKQVIFAWIPHFRFGNLSTRTTVMTIEFPQIKLIIIIIILETRLSYQAKHCEASYALISAYFPLCHSPMLTLYSNIIKSWEGF